MIATWRVCVAIARPYVPRTSRQARPNASLSGTSGLRFRTIADMLTPSRHAGKDTANAVGWQHPPGFKSPILRSSQALSRTHRGQGLTGNRTQGCTLSGQRPRAKR